MCSSTFLFRSLASESKAVIPDTPPETKMKLSLTKDQAAFRLMLTWRKLQWRKKLSLRLKENIKDPAKGFTYVEAPLFRVWQTMSIEEFTSPASKASLNATLLTLSANKKALLKFASIIFSGCVANFGTSFSDSYVKLACTFADTAFLTTAQIIVYIKKIYDELCLRLSKTETCKNAQYAWHEFEDVDNFFTKDQRDEIAYAHANTMRKSFKITDVVSAMRIDQVHTFPRKPFTADPHAVVMIGHGGGFNHICNFLSGKTLGYPLEDSNKASVGIQVHPHRDRVDHEDFYARKAANYFLDYPCRLTATINACYLDTTDNPAEAGLRAEYVSKLQDIRIELFTKSHELEDFKNNAPLYRNTFFKMLEPLQEHKREERLRRLTEQFQRLLKL